MSARAVLRTNVHEDESRTYDVLLSDGPDGDNTLEVNCLNERHAEDLLELLGQANYAILPSFINRYSD